MSFGKVQTINPIAKRRGRSRLHLGLGKIPLFEFFVLLSFNFAQFREDFHAAILVITKRVTEGSNGLRNTDLQADSGMRNEALSLIGTRLIYTEALHLRCAHLLGGRNFKFLRRSRRTQRDGLIRGDLYIFSLCSLRPSV